MTIIIAFNIYSTLLQKDFNSNYRFASFHVLYKFPLTKDPFWLVMVAAELTNQHLGNPEVALFITIYGNEDILFCVQ